MVLCLKGFRVLDFNLKNHIQPSTRVKLNTTLNHKVNFHKDRVTALCHTTVEVRAEKSVDFLLSIVLESIFTFDEDDKKAVHVSTYKAIYPTVKDIVKAATKSLHMTVLDLPDIELPEEEIHHS